MLASMVSSRSAGWGAGGRFRLQFWGGIQWESGVARELRDIRLSSIGGGADEVMLASSANMGTARESQKP